MLLDEKLITCALIDYLERHGEYDFIAREVPFESGSRRADLVFGLEGDSLTSAIEIKSDIDSLTRLESQLSDYKNVFNFVYVATTKKYLAEVRKRGLWFGIIVINSSGEATLIRKARRRLRTNQNSILNSVDSNYAKELMKNKPKYGSLSNSTLYFEWLKSRYKSLYQLFLKERANNPTSVYDLPILSLRSDKIIF